MSKSKSRRIAFISCAHIGSLVGIWPDEFTYFEDLKTEQTLYSNAIQKQIFEYFKDFWTHEAQSADTICLLGDLCQGKNVKDFGGGVITPKLDVQIECAKQVLEPFIDGRQLMGVSGSGYHGSMDTSIDKAIIEGLGGTFYHMMQTITLKGPGTRLNIAHGSSSPSMYKASHDDREIMLMSSNSMTRDIDFAVRGHWHYFQYLRNARRHILRVPGWQCWYPAPFMLDMLGKKNNKLGGVVVDFHPDNKAEVHERLYEPPATWGKSEEI